MECGRDSWICDVLKTQIYGPLIPMTHGASIMLWDSLACVAELKVIVFFIFYVSSVLYSELFHGSVNSIFFDSFYGTLRTLFFTSIFICVNQLWISKVLIWLEKCFWINEIMKWNMNNLLHQVCVVLYNCLPASPKKREIKSYYNRHFEFCHQPLGWWFLEAKTVTVSSLNINFQRCNALMGEKKIEKGFALKNPNWHFFVTRKESIESLFVSSCSKKSLWRLYLRHEIIPVITLIACLNQV